MYYGNFTYRDNLGYHFHSEFVLPHQMFKLLKDLSNLANGEDDEENIIHVAITYLSSTIGDLFYGIFLEYNREFRERAIIFHHDDNSPELTDVITRYEVDGNIIKYTLENVFDLTNTNQLPFNNNKINNLPF